MKPNRLVVRDERRVHERTKKKMTKKKPSSHSLSLSLFRALIIIIIIIIISITESVVLNKKRVQKREKKCMVTF